MATASVASVENRRPLASTRGLLLFASRACASASNKGLRQRGFSAIELIAAVAVTLTIGALGVSVYETYSVRAEVVNVLLQARALEKRVEAYFRLHREPPVDRDAVRLSASDVAVFTPLIDAIDVINGRIDFRFGAQAAAALSGRQLSLTPYETAEQHIVWVCGNKIAPPGIKPLGFAAGARQSLQVLTAIDSRYLPTSCR